MPKYRPYALEQIDAKWKKYPDMTLYVARFDKPITRKKLKKFAQKKYDELRSKGVNLFSVNSHYENDNWRSGGVTEYDNPVEVFNPDDYDGNLDFGKIISFDIIYGI